MNKQNELALDEPKARRGTKAVVQPPAPAKKPRKPRTPKYGADERVRRLGWIRTRAPRQLWDYVLWLSRNPALGFKTLQALTTELMVEFSEKKPWEAGLKWREPKNVVDGAGNPTGWVQVNMQLATTNIHDAQGHERQIRGEDFALLIREAANQCGVSQATYAYTALWYLTVYKYPPQPQQQSAAQ